MAIYHFSSVARDLSELRDFSVCCVPGSGLVQVTGDATFIFSTHGLLSAERGGKSVFAPGKPVPFSGLRMQAAVRNAVNRALERS